MVACRTPNSFNLARYLLACGAPPNPSGKGGSALQIVMEVVGELVTQEAKLAVKLVRARGCCVLRVACCSTLSAARGAAVEDRICYNALFVTYLDSHRKKRACLF